MRNIFTQITSHDESDKTCLLLDMFEVLIILSILILQMDLGIFINKGGCESLNESDDHHLAAALAKGPDFLESDCDEQVHVLQRNLIYRELDCSLC